MPVHVRSEIGRLRTAVVHTPGPELLAVTPSTREDYLYDDIIDVEIAQREHRRFVAILERFSQVLYVRDLAELPDEAVVQMLVEGREEAPGPLARTLNECGYALPPVHNLFFTRDSAMVVGEHVLIGSMRFGARWSEELIMKTLFMHHPLLESCGILYDGAA